MRKFGLVACLILLAGILLAGCGTSSSNVNQGEQVVQPVETDPEYKIEMIADNLLLVTGLKTDVIDGLPSYGSVYGYGEVFGKALKEIGSDYIIIKTEPINYVSAWDDGPIPVRLLVYTESKR